LSHPVTVLVAVALTICSNERLTEVGEAVADARIAAPVPPLQAANAPAPSRTAKVAMQRFIACLRIV